MNWPLDTSGKGEGSSSRGVLNSGSAWRLRVSRRGGGGFGCIFLPRSGEDGVNMFRGGRGRG